MQKILGLLAIFIASLLLLCPKFTQTPENAFQSWKSQHGMKFSEEQDSYRYGVFIDNLNKIDEHNAKVGKTYKMGMNHLGALTDAEFQALYLTHFQTKKVEVKEKEEEAQEQNGPSVDWVTFGAVSPVKNMGSCPCTYAFAAVGAVEGLSVIVYKTQQEFSVQQLVDCSQSFGNSGCQGGRMDYSFNYIKSQGLNLQAAYPYTGMLGQCRVSAGFFKIGGYASVQDCQTLENAIQVGPVSVAVDGRNFQFYQSGIFSNCYTYLTLAGLLVGMNDYSWTMKNSWGSAWGEGGYIRLARGNTCGICQDASYPRIS